MEGCDKFQVYKSGPLFISSKGITLISAVVASIFLSFTFNVGGDLIVVVVDGDDDNELLNPPLLLETDRVLFLGWSVCLFLQLPVILLLLLLLQLKKLLTDKQDGFEFDCKRGFKISTYLDLQFHLRAFCCFDAAAADQHLLYYGF
jgi:hypothetical protein